MVVNHEANWLNRVTKWIRAVEGEKILVRFDRKRKNVIELKLLPKPPTKNVHV